MDSRNETRDSLSASVAAATGFTVTDCRNVLDSLLVEIICRCREGEKVFIEGLGTFIQLTRFSRPYHFPERKMMPARVTSNFRFYADKAFQRKIKDESADR